MLTRVEMEELANCAVVELLLKHNAVQLHTPPGVGEAIRELQTALRQLLYPEENPPEDRLLP